ncbi:hypothetical protein PIIN_10424, partial [Serendipita indica DSM 11827]
MSISWISSTFLMSAQKTLEPKELHRITNTSGSSSFAQCQTSEKRQVIYGAVDVGVTVLGSIADASDILSPLKAACQMTKVILDAIQAVENSRGEWIDLTWRLKQYMSAIEDQVILFEAYPAKDRAVNDAFSRPLIKYVKCVRYIKSCRFLETMHDRIVDLITKRSRSKPGFLKALIRAKIDTEEILKLNRDIRDQHRQFMTQEALATLGVLIMQNVERNVKVNNTNVGDIKAIVETIQTDVDSNAILQLPKAALVSSSVHKTCLAGTREAVLQTVWRWAADDASEEPIFWLCDIAGSGKSTVAMSAVEFWHREGVLGGRFFFSITSSEYSTTGSFCSIIARDLVDYFPELTPHVARAIRRHPSFMRNSLDEQFRILVTDPLHHWQGRVILVIDALDECKSRLQRRELIEVLSKAVQGSKNLKIFMTSRPDPVIEAALGSLAIQTKLEDRLHDVNHQDNVDDIALYVHKTLDGVLSEDKRQRLIDKANGLFIWASTACQELKNEETFQSPESIYSRLISVDQTGEIDDVYNLLFERMDTKSYPIMCSLLALLLAAFEPLSVADLDDISRDIGATGDANALVRNLGSVLSVDPSTNLIQFRHPTFVEYLRRCSHTSATGKRSDLYLDIATAHGQAASWCLKRLMSRRDGLKFNICQIESSFSLNREIPDIDARVSRFIPRRLRYAGSHWLFHMAETNDSWRFMLRKELRYIIQVPNVLHWMEVLSFTGGVSRAITGLRALMSCTSLEQEARTTMDEIRQFIITFSVPIQDSAPHIYISALPFTPTESKIHTEGLERHNNVIYVTQGLEKRYPGLPGVLRGHKRSVLAITFSPDGSKMASSSSDNTIRLWDAYTGQPLGEPLRGHEDSVWALAFSSQGTRIISTSRDRAIRSWD